MKKRTGKSAVLVEDDLKTARTCFLFVINHSECSRTV